MRPAALLRAVARQLVPLLLVPLAVLADVLAAAPWLRSFPVTIAGAPLYGAAIISVLVPFAMARLRSSWFALSVAVDVVVFVGYTLLVVLQEPAGVGDLLRGLYDGPSQLLTFALPLVSPRSLMVAPVAVIWLAGALAGECVARRWFSVLPYVGLLVAFGLSYAATQRAATDSGSLLTRESLLAAGLLATLLLMRVAQTWVREDETAKSTQPDGVLPLRGLLVGTLTVAVIAVLAAVVVQADVFPKRASSPQRVPSVIQATPLTPLAFVAGLRPQTTSQAGTPVFTVRTDRPSSGYFEIANVDLYDGAGWSFDRTFRPSGGVLPDDPDGSLRAGALVTQHYLLASTALTTGPWMPYLYRAQTVSGTGVNIDPASGMIVPAGQLGARTAYTVTSRVAATTFAGLDPRTASADTATSTIDTQVPGELAPTLNRLVSSFASETGVPSSPALPFLQALQRDLVGKYSLTGYAQSAGSQSASSQSAGSSSSSAPGGSRSSTPSSGQPAQSSQSTGSPDKAGSTSFADVLGSIVGTDRAGTPEQYATLVALVARTLGVPARVATGFRVTPAAGARALAAGSYAVTTADAWSWVDIPVVGAGWVALDATPTRASNAPVPSQSAAPATSSSSAPSSQDARISAGSGGHAAAKPVTVHQRGARSHDGVLIALLVIVVVIALVLLVLLLSRKRVRAARRRRAHDPRQRLIGAWQESLDMLTESGLPELTALTSNEIARLTGEQFGADTGAEAAALGSAANAVTYSERTVVAPEQADAAWVQQRRLQRTVRGQLGLRARVAAGLRYHREGATVGPHSPPSWSTETTARRERAAQRRRGYRGRRRAH